MRNWDIEAIKNSSILNDDIKEIMLQEYNGSSLSDKDPNNFSARKLSYHKFKRAYYNDLVMLVQLLGNNYFITTHIHTLFPYDSIGRYDFEESDFDEEDLIAYTLEFYEYLGDKELLEKIKYLLDKKQSFVAIKPYDENNPICNEVRGRCIKPQNTNDPYMSYYMKGTSEDLSIFAHETGHMLSHALFRETINPLCHHFLSETESYLMELLMNSYISDILELPELAVHLEANRTAKIIDVTWNIRAEQILYRQFGRKPNMNRLKRKLMKEGFGPIATNLTFEEITIFSLFELNHLLHSYLVALHFYKEVIKDREKGFYEYKKFIQSKAPTANQIYEEAGIDYEELIHQLNYMYEKAVALKLTHDDI